MSSASPNPFRYRLETKKTKDFDKEEKLKSIKKNLDEEFQGYIKEPQNQPKSTIDTNKLKLEYNKLIFQNICKQKQIEELQSRIKSNYPLRRTSTNGTLEEAQYLLKSEDFNKEIQVVQRNLEIEALETQLLNKMKQKEKNTVVISKQKQLEEKIKKIHETRKDLEKYTEKVIRTGCLAENLYEKISKSLNTSRKHIFNAKSSRKAKLSSLKYQESQLSTQVKSLESELTNSLYNQSIVQTRVNFLTARIDNLLINSFGTRSECANSTQFIKDIKKKAEILEKLIRSSRLINEEVPKVVQLGDMGKYLNMLIFSESQLQLRYSELIRMQSVYQNNIQGLRNELEDIKGKFKDSEFIENWNVRQREMLKKIDHEEINKKLLNPTDLYELEKTGILSLKSVIEMYEHLKKLVEEINSYAQESRALTIGNNSILRQRTLSLRYSIDTLAVLTEDSGSAYFYQFTETIKTMLQDRFKNISISKIDYFIKSLVSDYMIKNFLNTNDFAYFLEKMSTPEEAFAKYYKLYEPAHDTLRKKIYKASKGMMSFISGVAMISEQVMVSFDKNALTELQTDKLIAINPQVSFTSRMLKDIVKDVVKYKAGDMPKELFKKIIKIKKEQKVKDFGMVSEKSDEEKNIERVKKVVSKQNMHARSQSQKEIKLHLDEINTMLVKSKRIKIL